MAFFPRPRLWKWTVKTQIFSVIWRIQVRYPWSHLLGRWRRRRATRKHSTPSTGTRTVPSPSRWANRKWFLKNSHTTPLYYKERLDKFSITALFIPYCRIESLFENGLLTFGIIRIICPGWVFLPRKFSRIFFLISPTDKTQTVLFHLFVAR